MMTKETMKIDELLIPQLKKRHDLSDSEWAIWEHRTWNIHRAVLVWSPAQTPTDYSEVSEAIRNKIQQTQKVSWWRGMGFGFIGIFPSLPKGIEACVDDIDVRENAKGTWQWSVICLGSEKAAVGAHMWMQGYLTPTYQTILSQFEADGYKVASFKKEKDKLTEFLTYALQLPEFQNESSTQPSAQTMTG